MKKLLRFLLRLMGDTPRGQYEAELKAIVEGMRVPGDPGLTSLALHVVCPSKGQATVFYMARSPRHGLSRCCSTPEKAFADL